MLRRHDADALRETLRERLHDIGWLIDENGNLTTQDALVSEHFFPPNSEYDAYVTIGTFWPQRRRSLLSKSLTSAQAY